MRIGLTYDLRDDYLALGFAEEEVAEFDCLDTIDALDGALDARFGYEVERVGHGRALAARLVAGERCDLVFNIAEGRAGRSREAQVPALLELFDQPYLFSDPLTCAAALDKAMAKRVVRDAGVPTPPSSLRTRSASELAGWSDVPGLRQAGRRRHRQGLRGGLAGAQSPAELAGRGGGADRALPPAGAGRDAICPAASSPSASSATATTRACSASARSCSRRRPRPTSTRCTTRSCARSWSPIAAPTTTRRGCRDAGARRLSRARCRDAARIDFRSDAEGEPLFPRGQPARRAAPAGIPTCRSSPRRTASPSRRLIGMILDAGLARYGLAAARHERATETRLMRPAGGLHPGPACGDGEPPRRDRQHRHGRGRRGGARRLGYATEIVAARRRPRRFRRAARARRCSCSIWSMRSAATAGSRHGAGAARCAWAALYRRRHRRLARHAVEGRDQAEARACRPADARLVGGRDRARPTRA